MYVCMYDCRLKYKMTAEEEVVLLRKIQKLEQDHSRLKHHLILLLINKCDQYLNILESMGRSVHIFDGNHRIIYWNQMSEHLYGYTRAEALGKTAPDIIIEPRYSHLATLIIQRALKGETWSGQFPVRTKYAHTFLVITTLSPFRDQHATTFGVTCVSTDTRQFQPQPSNISSNFFKMKTTTQDHININLHDSTTNENRPSFHKLLSLKAEAWIDKKGISWPWKLVPGINQNTDTTCHHITTTPTPFGLPCLHNTNNHQHPQTTASLQTHSSNIDAKSHTRLQNLDVHISWEDLIIQEQIGQGSRGTVYHALLYGSDVAVKIFSTQTYSDDVIRSFRKEVSIMKRLRHPNILLFMGLGSLFRLLQHSIAKLDWRRRVHMAMDMARGMNYLHHCQPPVIHRNLKSSNLLVDKNLTLKVGDFGLSRIKHTTYLMTNTKTVAPHWMAPEILRNEHVDEKSDVYSYGVVLWEITTGKIPWENLNSVQVIRAVGFMNQWLDIPDDVDPHWASLIRSCWSREPQSRPTFQEILIKLKDLQKKFTMQLKGPCRNNSSSNNKKGT
ncbi:hypothetical protein QVD17_19880 [Tagetes erecta]|uniref:non-specific serine/threonine protein kinase n=1 Tax=Tagetes erecta TaxID=13708 RepID=A0AAD8NWV2_TARER|nr:hypothetical protein QVD17_19880 [Tagetes erecta]